MNVVEAFDHLIAFASEGRTYEFGEVWKIPKDHPKEIDRHRIVGNGYDFTHTVFVNDVEDRQAVEGVLHFRVMRMSGDDDGPSLFVRTRVEWTTSDSEEHISSASYELSRTVVTRMMYAGDDIADIEAMYDELGDNYEPTSDERRRIFGVLFERLREDNSSLETAWKQRWPGSDAKPQSEEERQAYGKKAEYHGNAVLELQKREPLACMLSDTDWGMICDGELEKLSLWVSVNA